MLGNIAHAFQFREGSQQLFLDTIFQGHIDHRTAVTAAAKLQNGVTFIGDLHQRHATAMTSQLWVDLRLQQVLNALNHGRIIRDFTHLGIRCFQRQLRTEIIGNEVDFRIFQIRLAQLINVGGELFKLQFSVGGFNGIGRTVRDATLGCWRTRVNHEYANLGAIFLFG